MMKLAGGLPGVSWLESHAGYWAGIDRALVNALPSQPPGFPGPLCCFLFCSRLFSCYCCPLLNSCFDCPP